MAQMDKRYTMNNLFFVFIYLYFLEQSIDKDRYITKEKP